MADPEKPKSGPPESPTTARELDFDDDDVPSPPKDTKPARAGDTSPTPTPKPEVAGTQPAPPTQPLNPREHNMQVLKEAFPSIEASVVKAVLVASGGQVEPAFNALLSMSDPESQQETMPPPQPPRPAQRTASPGTRSQYEADELYARQLAEHYQNQAAHFGLADSSRDQRGQDSPRVERPRRDMGLKPNELYDDREHSFIDDDLPVIRENIRKGFLETQSKVNSFLTNLKKKIDGEDEDDEMPPAQPPRPGTQRYGSRRSGEAARRSADRERYDADPEILGDDFAHIHMHDETTPQRRSPRPQANPDLFKPTPPAPVSERKVSFQEGRPEIINDALDTDKSTPAGGNRGKWQPLASADPNPIADHDPFSLGDSDDDEPKRKDGKVEDNKVETDAALTSKSAGPAKAVEAPAAVAGESKESSDPKPT